MVEVRRLLGERDEWHGGARRFTELRFVGRFQKHFFLKGAARKELRRSRCALKNTADFT